MEKIYRVQMNSKGMPNFSTAVEVADRPEGESILQDTIRRLEEVIKHGVADKDGMHPVAAEVLLNWLKGADFDEWHKLMEIFYNEGVADAWDIAQTVFESSLTLNEAKDLYRQMKGTDNE